MEFCGAEKKKKTSKKAFKESVLLLSPPALPTVWGNYLSLSNLYLILSSIYSPQ